MKDSFNENLHSAAYKKLYAYARALRKTETEAEKILWQYLRGRKFHGLKFRRQHPLDSFIADFYCHEKKFVVELDGDIHDDKFNALYDQARTNDLVDLGITVIRFKNEEVLEAPDKVLNRIWLAISQL